MAKFTVLCGTEGCKKFNKKLNSYKVKGGYNGPDADTLCEGFGHGAENPKDFCPLCGELGILEDF